MKRLYYLDKLGWPVELVKGRWFLNFLRILIHTRKYTFKRPRCLDAPMGGYTPIRECQGLPDPKVQPLPDLSSEEVRGMVHEVIDHEQKILAVENGFGGVGYRKTIRDLQIAAAAADLQRSCGEEHIPNALTRETIEKVKRGEDVKSVDTVEELFEDLDKPNEPEDVVCNDEVRKQLENLDDIDFSPSKPIEERRKTDENGLHLY